MHKLMASHVEHWSISPQRVQRVTIGVRMVMLQAPSGGRYDSFLPRSARAPNLYGSMEAAQCVYRQMPQLCLRTEGVTPQTCYRSVPSADITPVFDSSVLPLRFYKSQTRYRAL